MSDNNEVRSVLTDILIAVLGKNPDQFRPDNDTELLGAIPEFDSMAVVSVLTAVEEEFGITIEDDDVDASVFTDFGALTDFIAARID